MKIAILYIALGEYNLFWKEFYESCEEYFLDNIEKKYFIFTDNDELEKRNNIEIIKKANQGWPLNTLLRFYFFHDIREQLIEYDYVYFFNANYLFKNKITLSEFLPKFNNDYLVVLSWDKVNKKKKIYYTYERNKKSAAYISEMEGEFYYQGGMIGGRTSEFIKLVKNCINMIESDKKINFIPICHDESYLNKYLLTKKPLRINEIYGMPEEWGITENIKAILRKKEEILGEYYLKNLKKRNLMDKINFKLNKIYLIFKYILFKNYNN